MHVSPIQIQALLSVARDTIRAALTFQALPSIETADPGLLQPAGCFVSLHAVVSRALRGCVGRMDAAQPLILCVRDTASGVLEDPRFVHNPVTLEELPNLEIEISILSPLKPASSPLDFDLLNDGICLTIAGQSGIFLPQVARETGWTKEQLLDRLCTEKLGLAARLWRHPQAQLQVFTTMILGPVRFEDFLD
jgi:AmmeMemoRadiSam system protein A